MLGRPGQIGITLGRLDPIVHSSSTTVGPSAISYVAGSSVDGNTSVIIAKPTGVVDGDVMVMTQISNGAHDAPPTGWTLQVATFDTNGFHTVGVYTKVASSEGASYTVTGASMVVTIDAYRGVNTTTPMDAARTTAGGSVATVTFPNITSVTDGAWHLTIAADHNGGTYTTPTNYTGRTQKSGGAAVAFSIGNFSREIAAAGAISGVQSTESGASFGWGAMSVLLRPA